MSAVLFNFHDVVLLITAILSGMLACLLFVFHGAERRISNYLLGAFLLMYAVIPLDKLVTYGEEFRFVAVEFSTNIFLLGNAALLLEGPLLYLYVRSVSKKGFTLQWRHLLHLVPLALYAIYAYWLYYQYDEITKYRLIFTLEVFNHASFKYFFGVRDLIRLAYGVAGIYALFEYQAVIKERYSEIQKIDMQWLVRIVVGFLLYRAWMFIESVYSVLFVFIHGDNTQGYIQVMALSGLLSGYMAFFLIVMLVFFSLRYSLILEGVEYVSQGNNRPVSLDWKIADRVSEYMQREKPYLEQNITVDELASRLAMPAKTFSILLNRHFGKNFFEYINSYRVEEAKKMLSMDEYKDVTIVDIMNEAGFSSKSAFNDFFKRVVGATPREYRKRQQGRRGDG